MAVVVSKAAASLPLPELRGCNGSSYVTTSQRLSMGEGARFASFWYGDAMPLLSVINREVSPRDEGSQNLSLSHTNTVSSLELQTSCRLLCLVDSLIPFRLSVSLDLRRSPFQRLNREQMIHGRISLDSLGFNVLRSIHNLHFSSVYPSLYRGHRVFFPPFIRLSVSLLRG